MKPRPFDAKSTASCKGICRSAQRNATRAVEERLMPITQCTKTRRPSCRHCAKKSWL